MFVLLFSFHGIGGEQGEACLKPLEGEREREEETFSLSLKCNAGRGSWCLMRISELSPGPDVEGGVSGKSWVWRAGWGWRLHLFLFKIKQNSASLYAFIPEAAKLIAEQKDSLSEMLK